MNEMNGKIRRFSQRQDVIVPTIRRRSSNRNFLMMKSGLERMLDTEMDVHLGRSSVGPVAAAPAASLLKL